MTNVRAVFLLCCVWIYTDHTDPGMSNMDEEKKLQSSLSNGPAGGPEEEAECAKTNKWILLRLFCNKHKAIIGIVIVTDLVFFFLGILVRSNYQKDAINYPPVTCPYDWIGHMGECYKFPGDEKNLMESEKICISHNASLVIKITKEEMAFLRMFTRDHVAWIGLRRGPDHLWQWLNGENSTLEVIGDGGQCAFLDDGTVKSGSCTTEHHYICKKK